MIEQPKNRAWVTLLALILIPTVVFGLSAKDFNWQKPTQRVNGDPLAPAEIANYRLKCGTQPGGPYDFMTAIMPGGDNEQYTTSEVFPEGTYHCVAQTLDTEGRESDNSGEVNFTVARCDSTDCRPMPPALSVGP